MKKVKIEGIYCFGGKDNKNKANNKLRVLKIGKSGPLKYKTIVT